ncbi:MAG TPA: VWA domain-containing protein [Polyangiaceae bacterium]|jgi:Ca-activated chloride channel family protein
MRVRTFALCASLGVAVSALTAMLVPTPSAGRSAPLALRVDPAPQPDAPGAHFVDGKALLLDARLGHATVARDSRGGSASTFVLATVTGADATPGVSTTSPPVHLAIVVDRSGSMAGPKMSNAVLAAVGAIEHMHDGDRATIVSFDTSARVLVPPTTLDSSTRPTVEAAIRAMRAGGDTCISCALTTATAELDASPGARDEVKRILLISDGEATTGVRDVTGLRALAGRARDRGIGVSTIGVDLAFDERVMAAIAQESNGRHFFVPDASALEQVFQEELGTLETAVASGAELSVDLAPGVVVEDVLDRSFRREGKRVLVPLGTFDAKEEKTVLLKVRVPADSDGDRAVADLSLTYRDVVAKQDARCSGSLALDVRNDGTAQRELDPFVAARVERSRTARTLTDANELFRKGKADDARAELSRRQREIAVASPTAVAAASALPQASRAFARPVDKDFEAQEHALSEAQSGFIAGAGGAAAPGKPAGPPPPAAKSALKKNQANAVDLAF